MHVFSLNSYKILGAFFFSALTQFACQGLAYAGGSCSLEDVLDLAKKQSPELAREIDDALKKSGQPAESVPCTASRFGNHWYHLGGVRSLPYCLEIGGHWLEIDGRITFYDDSGKEYEWPDDDSDAIENMVNKVTRFEESGLTWRWVDAKECG